MKLLHLLILTACTVTIQQKETQIHVGTFDYLIKPEIVNDYEKGITIYYYFYLIKKDKKPSTRKEECGYVEYQYAGAKSWGRANVINDTLLVDHYYSERSKIGDTTFILNDTTTIYYKPGANGTLKQVRMLNKPNRIDTLITR